MASDAAAQPSFQPWIRRLAVAHAATRAALGAALSDDRHTATVTTSYPLAGVCVKEADGVSVETRGNTAVVAAWMRGPELPMPDGTACTTECGFVTQSVKLPEPVPARVSEFEPVPHAVPGCA